MYEKARQGSFLTSQELAHHTNNSVNPELTIKSDELTIEESVQKVIQYLKTKRDHLTFVGAVPPSPSLWCQAPCVIFHICKTQYIDNEFVEYAYSSSFY
ncbi:hypothetical protein KHA80_15270 [Anaerobacillus sp. HL2]|nr:hypothetical protein KHA80_15270 [Anaerobacillus sp. HL2]